MQPAVGRVIRNIGQDHPEQLQELIRTISTLENREILSEVILTAILETNPRQADAYARYFMDHQDRSLRSLAMLIKAQANSQLTEQELDELTLIATGGGRISKQTRAIAGWLWLSHNGRTGEAMMEIMGES